MRLDRRLALKLFAAPAMSALPLPARAQQYPAKPIRIIVPYPAGGPYDGVARIVAQWIGARLGWSIVMDNRTGAVGTIGIMAARQAAADGTTLVVVTSSTHGSTPALKRSLPYDPLKDFVPIALMGDAALVLLVREELPVHSVAELVQMMRDKPGQLNYSTGGYGSQHHLATVTLFQRAGLPQNAAVHVPFAGLAPALMSLLAGNVQFMTSSTGAATQHIASGKLRALATTSLRRSSATAQRADDGGGRIPRLSDLRLVRPGGAGRHARRHRDALERAHERGPARPQGARADLRPRLRRPRRHDPRVRRVRRLGDAPLQEARRGHGLVGGLSWCGARYDGDG